MLMQAQESTSASSNEVIHLKDNVLLGFAIGIAIFADYQSGHTVMRSPVGIGLLVGLGVLVAAIHGLVHKQTKLINTIYLIFYHLMFGLMLVFVVPITSPFILLWVLVAYLAEYYYLLPGLISSLSLLFLTVVGATWYQQGSSALLQPLSILAPFLLASTLTILLLRIIFGARAERLTMAQKIVHAEYEHERLISLINSMTEAVLAVSDDGTIAVYNAAALDLLDTNTELAGQKIQDVLKLEDDQKASINALEVARQTTYLLKRTDLFLSFGKNDRIALELNISRTSLVSPLVKRQGYTFLLRDITQQKSLDEERDEFISVVSHELRTPITIAEANISMAQIIAEQPQPKPGALPQALDKAHKQVLFLSDMVNDLSTLSRAEREDKDMQVETFAIADIMKELESTYKPQAEKKSLYLKLETTPNLPRVTTSHLYLKEVLQNFVTNAIKYTQEGGITIRATMPDSKSVKISVTDTGIGISKSEQDRVYDKFWRSEDPLTRQNNGTGLGLYITAKLARRINARVDLQSEPKVGTTFSLTIATVAVKEIDQANVVKNEVANLLN